MVSDFTYLSSDYLSGYAILKFPFLWFSPKSIDIASTVPLPSRSFGYRPRTTCSGCWTVLAAIWFNIKLVSSVGSQFFRLLTVAINNYFFFLWASPGLRSLEIIECKYGVDQILQVSFAYLTEANFKLFDIVQNMPIVLQFVFVQTSVIAVARIN